MDDQWRAVMGLPPVSPPLHRRYFADRNIFCAGRLEAGLSCKARTWKIWLHCYVDVDQRVSCKADSAPMQTILITGHIIWIWVKNEPQNGCVDSVWVASKKRNKWYKHQETRNNKKSPKVWVHCQCMVMIWCHVFQSGGGPGANQACNRGRGSDDCSRHHTDPWHRLCPKWQRLHMATYSYILHAYYAYIYIYIYV